MGQQIRDRLGIARDRLLIGEPSGVEIHSAATDDMGYLLRRQFRRLVEEHQQDTGLILVGSFRLFQEQRYPMLRVSIGRRVEERHVNWRLQASTRTSVKWRSPIKLRRSGISGLPPRPRWITVRAEDQYLIRLEFREFTGVHHDNFEIVLAEGEKKLIFVSDKTPALIPWWDIRSI